MRFKSIATKIFVAAVFGWLLYLNGTTEFKSAKMFFSGRANDENFSYLGETKAMADYLMAQSDGSKTIYLKGDRGYKKRYYKPLNYILTKNGYYLDDLSGKGDKVIPGVPVFFIEETRYDKYRVGNKIGSHYRIEGVERFGRVSLIIPKENEKN